MNEPRTEPLTRTPDAPPQEAELMVERLAGRLVPAAACRLLRGEQRAFALSGGWDHGFVMGSRPVAWVSGEAALDALDRQPHVRGAAPGAVGGGWVGHLGYGLGRALEPVPPSPPRYASGPPSLLAFYDHLVRCDEHGGWWFEALVTPSRAAALERRRAHWAQLLAGPEPPARAVSSAPWRLAPPGGAGHMRAIAQCRERIAAGELFQANLCLRLESRLRGDAVDLFAAGVQELAPRHAALLLDGPRAIVSMSPELFLRRSGDRVSTEPIKGTRRRGGPGSERMRAELEASEKDRAEHVMIVDLMRNDLGRVCRYGSVEVERLMQARADPGVWHLVSRVSGQLREDARDGDLLRATFPPGSVTGAPKIRAQRVIAELEGSAREAYTGAIGIAGPLNGLELSVAIRTFELDADARLALGVGGGIVSGSDPVHELEECATKAAPLLALAGGTWPAPARAGVAPLARSRSPGGGVVPWAWELADVARPDPRVGVFTTLAVRDGSPLALDAHLERLSSSARTLWDAPLPPGLRAALIDRASTAAALRVALCERDGSIEASVETRSPAPSGGEPPALSPVVLPGGLGAHKWIDRALLDALARALGAVPLLIDADGALLEAAYANVFVVRGDELLTPPADGRILPGIMRAELLGGDGTAGGGRRAAEAELSLEDLERAEGILLSSTLRGLHPARLASGWGASATPAPRLRS